jgi:hypothetical protein
MQVAQSKESYDMHGMSDADMAKHEGHVQGVSTGASANGTNALFAALGVGLLVLAAIVLVWMIVGGRKKAPEVVRSPTETKD